MVVNCGVSREYAKGHGVGAIAERGFAGDGPCYGLNTTSPLQFQDLHIGFLIYVVGGFGKWSLRGVSQIMQPPSEGINIHL